MKSILHKYSTDELLAEAYPDFEEIVLDVYPEYEPYVKIQKLLDKYNLQAKNITGLPSSWGVAATEAFFNELRGEVPKRVYDALNRQHYIPEYDRRYKKMTTEQKINRHIEEDLAPEWAVLQSKDFTIWERSYIGNVDYVVSESAVPPSWDAFGLIAFRFSTYETACTFVNTMNYI